ncbi:hypothetical protein BST92_09410 [Nonlabens arenilitoris]|uniref:Uncharacterized protein n=1 Tax=Nonlabens arenilitoris TaxID=1217969 RepID=A0A2S7UB28_9FLAO|nr:hypothetical protein [Nonlabens arenilitoris]PQJ32126.1 hypothetical protein BST92_09410 [Nonlabens arenilitoris]
MRIFTLLFIFLSSQVIFAQVGINTSSPADGTALDINETDKGILIPKVALSASNSLSGISLSGSTLEEGVLVYNINVVNGSNPLNKGFYYWNGTDQWIALGNDSDWSLEGNTITSTNRLGSNNSQPVIIKTNSSDRFRFETNGTLRSIANGTETSPSYSFVNSSNSGMYLSSSNLNLTFTSNGDDFLAHQSFGSSSQITFNPDGDPDMNLQIRGDSGVILNANPERENIQIGANSNPDYASLSLAHSDKGFLPNRINIADLSTFAPLVSDPLNGLIAYNSRTSSGTEGLYVWQERWNRIITSADKDYDWHVESTTNAATDITDNIYTNGSVGIGTTSIEDAASLELGATDKGLLINRVALTDASLAAPVTGVVKGTIIYNTNEDLSPSGYRNDVREGLYSWNGSRWIPQFREDRSARFGNAASRPQNLNDFTGNELELFAFNEWNDDTSLFTVAESDSQTRLTVNEDGRYRIVVAMAMVIDPTTTVADLQLDAELRIDRSGSFEFPGSPTSNNYIRNRNGVNTSSINITEIIEIQAGDEIFVHVEQAGNNGTITMRPDAGSNFFTIEKIK